jgi:hypothetical protein
VLTRAFRRSIRRRCRARSYWRIWSAVTTISGR